MWGRRSCLRVKSCEWLGFGQWQIRSHQSMELQCAYYFVWVCLWWSSQCQEPFFRFYLLFACLWSKGYQKTESSMSNSSERICRYFLALEMRLLATLWLIHTFLDMRKFDMLIENSLTRKYEQTLSNIFFGQAFSHSHCLDHCMDHRHHALLAEYSNRAKIYGGDLVSLINSILFHASTTFRQYAKTPGNNMKTRKVVHLFQLVIDKQPGSSILHYP